MGRSVNLPHMVEMRSLLARALCALALLTYAGQPAADTGTVEQLSGTQSVKGADGKIRILSRKSVIRSGDTINSEQDSYAQIKNLPTVDVSR